MKRFVNVDEKYPFYRVSEKGFFAEHEIDLTQDEIDRIERFYVELDEVFGMIEKKIMESKKQREKE